MATAGGAAVAALPIMLRDTITRIPSRSTGRGAAGQPPAGLPGKAGPPRLRLPGRPCCRSGSAPQRGRWPGAETSRCVSPASLPCPRRGIFGQAQCRRGRLQGQWDSQRGRVERRKRRWVGHPRCGGSSPPPPQMLVDPVTPICRLCPITSRVRAFLLLPTSRVVLCQLGVDRLRCLWTRPLRRFERVGVIGFRCGVML
jgi:hypothetical protein